jgi:hypothetical protein
MKYSLSDFTEFPETMNLYTKFVSYGLVGHNTVYHMFIENFVDQEVVIPYLLQVTKSTGCC